MADSFGKPLGYQSFRSNTLTNVHAWLSIRHFFLFAMGDSAGFYINILYEKFIQMAVLKRSLRDSRLVQNSQSFKVSRLTTRLLREGLT